MASILLNDTELRFPNFTVISASAGSGKTHTLTLKLLQLMLSDRIPNNRMNNILAMTFTKNSATEMRQRLLEYLKRAYHGDKKILKQVLPLVSMTEEQLRARCGDLIETILQDYSAFQVQTIDSFMARIFRASALEFGFSPALKMKPDSRPMLDAAFEQFARELTVHSSKRFLLEQLTDILVEQNTTSRYIWNPFQKLSDEIRSLYGTLSAQSKEILLPPSGDPSAASLRKEILDTFYKLRTLVRESDLETTIYFEAVIDAANSGNVDDIIYRKSLYNLPVKKSSGRGIKDKVEKWNERFAPIQQKIKDLASEYIMKQVYCYYSPYIESHRLFSSTIEQNMRRNGQISLSDVNRALLKYISEESVPQIYFYLGDAVFHYLIDEFQDTAPVQWDTMKPLFAEALSKHGSMFVVGDMKQSIYGFRHADWRIMKNLIDGNVFPSAPPDMKELDINFRSYENILNFNKEVFHNIVPREVEGEAPHASGLSSFKQEVQESNRKKGYVEVISFEKDKEEEPERVKILDIVGECRARGYQYRDITILTPKNQDVIAVSGWLNSNNIPFVSHSSLDIRGQAVTGEIIALLRFLDSPIDDLAFTTFLLSNVFHRVIRADRMPLTKHELRSFLIRERHLHPASPLYASFRKRDLDVWNTYFEELFNVVGYLPMYDLVSEIYKQFRIFELAPEEEGTLVKFLEVIKNFEETGQNNLKNFLSFSEEEADDSEWNIAVPRDANAVSVMTIHKAKGLDNRVVIILLVDSKRRAENRFIEEGDEGVRLMRIKQKDLEFNPELQKLYDKYRVEQDVDDLNKLYVAFTRAKEEMYVISVTTKTSDVPSKYLPHSSYGPSEKPKVEHIEVPSERIAALYHSPVRIPSGMVSQERLALYERRRGEAIHEVLSYVEYVDAGIETLVSSAVHERTVNWLDQSDAAHMAEQILEFLQTPEIRPYFAAKKNRIILNEQELVSPQGRLFRLDRIVVDEDTVTVIDFKTGDDKDEYTDQVRGYMDILKDFYSERSIYGVLAFIDKKKLRVII